MTYSYPTEDKYANLDFIDYLKKKLKKISIGYSDHTIGFDAAILSATLGARVIEKHFTLDKNFSLFRDHQLSADVIDLKIISKFLQKFKILLGNGKKKKLCKPEIKNYNAFRRSLYASKNINKGEIYSEKNLIHLRPRKNNNIDKYKSLINKKSKKNYKRGALI